MKNKLKFALLAFALVVLAGCPSTGVGTPQALGGVQLGWLNAALVASFAMFSVIGLLYMFSQLLGMPTLAAWCRNEIFQAAATIAMIIIVLGGFSALHYFIQSFVYQSGVPDYTVMERAKTFQICMADGLWQTYNELIGFAVLVGLFQSSTIHVRPLRMGFSIQPATMLRPISDNLGIGLTALSTGYMGELVEWVILRFADSTMLMIFLPLGIFFRSFPFTRQLGGTILAIAISFYAVYPLTVLLNEAVYAEHYNLPLVVEQTAPNYNTYRGPCDVSHPYRSFGGRMRMTVNAFVEYMAAVIGNPGPGGMFTQIFGLAGAFFSLMWGGLARASLGWLITTLIFAALINFSLAVAKEVIFLVVVMTILMSVIDWMIVFTFARSLAQVLGSDLDLSALLKLL